MKQLGVLILPLGWKIPVHHKVTPKIRRYSFIILGKGGGGKGALTKTMTKLGLEAEFFGVQATNNSVTASHI